MATAQDVRRAVEEDGLVEMLVAVRTGSDGTSAVAVCLVGGVGLAQNALVSRGYAVAVEDSENPSYSSLRVR